MLRAALPSARVLSVALLAVLCSALPLWRGGVVLPAQLGALACASAALLFAPRRSEASVSAAALALALLALAALLQLVPLPPGVLRWLAPAAAAHFEAFLRPIGLFPAARPLSLDPGATALELGRALAVAAAALAAAVAGHDPRLRRWLLGGVAFGGALVALVSLGASLGGATPYLEPRVVFVNPNHLAGLMNLSAFIALGFGVRTRGPWRAVWLAAFAVCGTEVALSLSRAGITAFVLGALAFGWLQARGRAREGHPVRQRALLLGAVLGVAAIAAVLAAGPVIEELRTVRHASEDMKIAVWLQALRLLRDHWATGIGRGAFATTYAGYKLDPAAFTFTHVENELLQLPIDVGLPIGLLVLGALGWSFGCAARRPDLSRPELGALAGLAALAAQNVFDFSLELPGAALPAAVALCAVAPRLSRRAPSWLLRAAACLALALGTAAFWAGSRYPADDASARAEEAGAAGAEAAVLPFASWHPADYLPHAAAGAMLVRADRCAEAMPWLDRAMLLNPTVAEPHHYVARCLAAARQVPAALREFRLAAELGDGTALREASSWFRSLDDLRQAAPATPAGQRELAEALSPARPADAALVLGGLWDDYGDPEVLPLLAQARLSAKDDAGALEASQRYLAVHPADPRASLLAYWALQRLQREDEGWTLLDRADQVTPGQPEIVAQLVERSLGRRRFSEARRLAESISPRTTAEMSARERLTARVLLAQGRGEEAVAHLELAVASAPTDRQPLEALAAALEAVGRPGDAARALLRAGALPFTPAGCYDARISALRARQASPPATESPAEP